jgi:ABC-type multidrug transport system fused ATPase/permease subunit
MKEWVTATQQRISATANLVANIESIKILGLTIQLSNLIQSMREVELEAGAIFRKLSVYSVFCAFAPMLLSPVLTFAATSLEVDTTRAFTSLAFLMLLTVPLSSLFQLLPNLVAAKACFDRIASYLEADLQPEYRTFGPIEPSTKTSDTRSRSGDVEHLKLSEGRPNLTSAYPAAFIIRNGYFGWTNDQYTLHEINLAIPESKMTMVVGPVGSGKSTFCKALLGEIPFAKGHVLCTSRFTRIGFCDQTSFIPNVSVRKVIVGCGQYDEEWYNKVIEATALSPDIVTFPNGDQSMAGPNGSNLSGGQRQRIAIARALYARPTVFIFDDIFSGLDDSTENIIFENVFSMNGLLRALGTTTILCSHAVRHLPCADHIVALGVDGRIVEQGTYEQLKVNQSYVHSLNIESIIQSSCQSDATTTAKASGPFTEPIATDFENDDRQKQLNDFAAHKRYLSTLGRIPLSCFAILSLLAAFCNNFSTIWLKFWSDYNTKHPQDKSRQGFYLGIYALIQSLSLFCLTIAIAITSIMMVKRSGRILHQQAIRALATAPLDLFNRTPPGVLLNRFSQDLNIVDTELEEHCFDFIFLTEIAIGMAIVVATASPYVMISYPVFGAILYRLQSFYLKTSKQLRFLDLETKSPLLYVRHRILYVDKLISLVPTS